MPMGINNGPGMFLRIVNSIVSHDPDSDRSQDPTVEPPSPVVSSSNETGMAESVSHLHVGLA